MNPEPLTDAELDSVKFALAASPIAFVASDIVNRAIAELRELRKEVEEWKEWGEGQMNDAVRAIEQNAALVTALEAIARRAPVMGSRDEYRRGQLDALEACRGVAREVLARVRGAE